MPLLTGIAQAAAGTKLRTRICFDFDWTFFLGDVTVASAPEFDDSNWRALNLPHDWSIEAPFDKDNPSGRNGGFATGGIGWYRKRFQVDQSSRGKRTFLLFDGVYQNSEVWINGQSLRVRPYGFIGFQHDLTRHLRFGKLNTIAVRVDNSTQPGCRWYSGSGIYRHVWLTTTDPLHIPLWGSSITTPRISPQSSTVRAKTRVMNTHTRAVNCELEHRIFDRDGKAHGNAFVSRRLEANSQAELSQDLELSAPQFWSIENPNLYQLETIVKLDGKQVDETVDSFGVRQIQFNKDKGFLLNGRPVKMKGVCLHNDAGCLGAAVPDRALERRLEVLKSIGCNAIRTSHNPPAPEFLDMCDRMGFVVIDEAFDKWEGRFAPQFEKWWKEDMLAMLRRDQNHPSVVLWSVGNESGTPGSDKLNNTMKQLVNFVHKEEPTRLVTCALVPPSRGDLAEKVRAVTASSKFMDVLSVNYQEQWYEEYRKADPNVLIIGTETYPYYHGDINTHTAFQPINPWYDVVKHDYVAGQFLWAGIDYLGESRGWPSKGWPTSPIDTCGFPKASSFFHRSVWRNEPLVRITVLHDGLDIDPGKVHWGSPKMAAHWNFARNEGELLRVETPTNCETAELIHNGKSLGVRRSADYRNSTPQWYVPYQSGKLEVIGRNAGQIAAKHQIATAGAPASIVLKPDRTTLRANSQDLTHIEVNLTDSAGVLVPDSDRLITFTVTGPAALIGVDNGDLRSAESYKGSARTTYWGKALAIVQSTRQPGAVRIEAKSANLPVAAITVQSH